MNFDSSLDCSYKPVLEKQRTVSLRNLVLLSGLVEMACAVARRLVACLLNISEARQKDLVENVAEAAITYKHGGQRKGVTVLNIFRDHDYNRSVITIVASIELIREAVLCACERACALIDMKQHNGVHPCMGAVDLLPLYPLGQDISLEDCGKEARSLATDLTERVPGTSAFLFGWADAPQHRGLARRRRESGWFRKVPDFTSVWPDVGPQPTARYGLTGVGASPYVMNCNVTIDTRDVALGRRVAAGVRESAPGGIAGVQVIALPHKGQVEIACNVESIRGSPPPPPPLHPLVSSTTNSMPTWPTFRIGDEDFCHAPASLIAARVAQLAEPHGAAVRGAVLVGFTPLECRDLAERALLRGIGPFWKELQGLRM